MTTTPKYIPSTEQPSAATVAARLACCTAAEQALVRTAAAVLSERGHGHALGPESALTALYALGCWLQKNPGVVMSEKAVSAW